MSDNSWYENGELPPVGSKCIVNSIDCRDDCARSFHGMEVDIHINMVDHQGCKIAVFSMIDPEDNGCLKFHGMMQHCFRPIKTEREIAIDGIEKVLIDHNNSETRVITLKSYSCALYDAGYRKNES